MEETSIIIETWHAEEWHYHSGGFRSVESARVEAQRIIDFRPAVLIRVVVVTKRAIAFTEGQDI